MQNARSQGEFASALRPGPESGLERISWFRLILAFLVLFLWCSISETCYEYFDRLHAVYYFYLNYTALFPLKEFFHVGVTGTSQ